MEHKFVYKTTNNYELPKYGFKIHVSSTLENYDTIFYLVKKYLSKKNLFYKYLASRQEFIKNISKIEAPSESGKLFTIYPPNIKIAEQIMLELSEILCNFEGIYILSDRNFRESNTVFYRFGFFKNVDNCEIEKNGKVWKDYQKCYYDSPSWIKDPFYHEKNSSIGESPLKTYHLTEIIQQSNAGNIYLGNYNNTKVIVKECRDNILMFEGMPCSKLRDNEYFISKDLDSKFFLQPIKKFKVWINNYYVYKYIEGQNLADWENRFFLFENVNQEKLDILTQVIKNLIELLLLSHTKKIALDDIHPNNFIIDRNNKISFIDLEYSHHFNQSINITAKTDGYFLKKWENLSDEEKDLRKFGELILFLLGHLNIFEGQERSTENTFLLINKIFDRFGIKTNISDLLKYLFTGNSAKKAVETSKNIYFLKFDLLNIIDETYLKSPLELKKFIEETNFSEIGLNGLVGYLWKLSYIKKSKIIEDKIEFLISQLNNSFLYLSGKYYSPYLLNGSCGLALFLMDYNFEKYQAIIIKIAEGMNVKYAKSMDFEMGLTGISYFLILLYKKTLDKKYLKWVDEQLETCQLLVESGKLYNYYTKKYETDFLKGYKGLKFVMDLRRDL
ncbi:serine/threonine protein kinase [Lactococcus lactis]|uniref:Serine/threonine protein kinase n=1 Tax=Lactococcus lactis TaxID=1358 RepID=A0AAE4NP88_9LACT|nr:serine/threonine protein kinase [Lactococcus lactis]MDV2631397.1 serine/threonine protein kinase [Lactococcus lactis]